MAGSFEKSVKGGTKIKLAAPKAKYVDHILTATRSGEAGVGEVFRTMDLRLRDPTWTIAFKALILVHLMIREGEPEATLRYLATNPRRLSPSSYADVQTQGRNIQHYSQYLIERAKAYRKAHFDYVRNGAARLKSLSVDKGLLWETECVQTQVRALLACDLLSDEVENEITITAFRLLTMDMLALFSVMNQGTINILEHYFEMSKPDAERALAIYKTFARQTDDVVRFLAVARQFEHVTKLEIPKIKHAPTGLGSSLEEYLNDNDFEINRRQYMVQQQAKKNVKSGFMDKALPAPSTSTRVTTITTASSKAPVPSNPPPQAKGPAPDLIDFFESIESNQQPMAQAPSQIPAQYQQNQFSPQTAQFYAPQASTGFQQQQQPALQMNAPLAGAGSNPFGQAVHQPQSPQSNFIPSGFANFGDQPAPQQQQSVLPQLQQSPFQNGASGFQSPPFSAPPFDNSQFQQVQSQTTNPFRASMMPTGNGASPAFPSFNNGNTQPAPPMPANPTGTNPFARTASMPTHITGQQSQSPTGQPSMSNPQSPTGMLQPQRTGTNPFARNPSPNSAAQSSGSPVISSPTGSTNPFRQSMFPNTTQQQPQPWSTGLEHIPTIPVFPRTGQQMQPQQSQQQQWP